MHKLMLLTAGAACALTVSIATRADAAALGGAEGIRIALEDMSAVETVAYRRAVVYRAPVRRAVAVGTAANIAAVHPFFRPSYAYGYAPGWGVGYGGWVPRAGYGGGYSDRAFGFGPTGSITTNR
jgi:hypothetical protein